MQPNASEIVAQLVVETVLDGSRMVFRSDQSGGSHDFDLHYPNGRVVALEVTAAVNAPDEETRAAISSRRKGGPTIKAELCRKAWRIRPGHGANINRIRKDTDRYLAAIESEGIEHFFSGSDRHTYPAVERIYSDLQISSGDVVAGCEGGAISIALPMRGGAVGGERVTDAVEVEAWKLDNRRKLGSAGAIEAHLFVFVDILNDRVWTPLVDLSPPPASPELPPEITHVWAVGRARSGDGYVAWRASAGSNWYLLGTIPAQGSAKSS